ncbi:class I SAM-dependent methyltransferase [Candidatus Pacearchaeota archaeon]|nr:class I SAM-dependent methyltransferase [Candidatus Pacearchaeota archaeon]
MENQEKVWDNIAEEWNEFKKIPANSSYTFLKAQKGNVLDLGSGSGRNVVDNKDKKYHLTDFSQKMLDLAKEKHKDIEIKKSNLWEIPYDDEFFDAAICISALHCVEEEDKRIKSIEELHRVLKPKAKALIGVWNAKSKRFKDKAKEKMISWQDKGKRYYYLYYKEEIQKQLEDAGFKVIDDVSSEMMINFIIEKD